MNVLGIAGIVLGICGGLFGLLYGRKKASEQRGLDERNAEITKNALATGWKVTLAAIYIFFVLLACGVQFSVPQVLGILLIIHIIGTAGCRCCLCSCKFGWNIKYG